MRNLFWSFIFRCDTHRRFHKAFDKMEDKGFDLFSKGEPKTASEQRAIRNYIKNLTKLSHLYDKFMSK